MRKKFKIIERKFVIKPSSNPSKYESFSAIIKNLMRECGIREAELARQTGLPQTTINRLLLGETHDPRANTLIPIATFFGVTVGQLLGQEPLNSERIAGTFNPTNRNAWTSIPVIEWNEAIGWLFKKNKYTPNSHKSWITTEKEVGPNSFALRTLSFMEPRFRKNSIVIVDPDSTYSDGLFVIVSINNTEPTIRRIVKDGDEIYLKKLYGKEEPIKKHNRDTIIGTIIETRINETY